MVSILRTCPKCGDIIGVIHGMAMLTYRRSDPNPNAPCGGTHGEPVKRLEGEKLGGLIKCYRTVYPDGSSSYFEINRAPRSIWEKLGLTIYVKILGNRVFAERA